MLSSLLALDELLRLLLTLPFPPFYHYYYFYGYYCYGGVGCLERNMYTLLCPILHSCYAVVAGVGVPGLLPC